MSIHECEWSASHKYTGLTDIILTHGHHDHQGGVNRIVKVTYKLSYIYIYAD